MLAVGINFADAQRARDTIAKLVTRQEDSTLSRVRINGRAVAVLPATNSRRPSGDRRWPPK
jgi:hypothetical protein